MAILGYFLKFLVNQINNNNSIKQSNRLIKYKSTKANEQNKFINMQHNSVEFIYIKCMPTQYFHLRYWVLFARYGLMVEENFSDILLVNC